MGFNIVSFRHYHNLLERLGINKKECIVVEFGAQQNWYSSKTFPKGSYFQLNFKDDYKEIHTFDLIKEHDQVTQFDLRNELILSYKADIITNMGTSEHVETDGGQQMFFKNFHNACKVGELMIHCVPEKDSYKDHCFYWYDQTFFKELATKNKYRVLELESIGVNEGHMNVWVAMIKTEDNEFIW